MYVVTGATGNTGRVIAETLLAKGKKVRAIGRNAQHLQPLVEKGAEAFVGSVTEGSAIARAFQGAQAAYVLIPPNYTAEHFRTYQKVPAPRVPEPVAGPAAVRHQPEQFWSPPFRRRRPHQWPLRRRTAVEPTRGGQRRSPAPWLLHGEFLLQSRPHQKPKHQRNPVKGRFAPPDDRHTGYR